MTALNFNIRKFEMVLYARGKVLVFDIFYCFCMGENLVVRLSSIFWLNEIFEKVVVLLKNLLKWPIKCMCTKCTLINSRMFTGESYSQVKLIAFQVNVILFLRHLIQYVNNGSVKPICELKGSVSMFSIWCVSVNFCTFSLLALTRREIENGNFANFRKSRLRLPNLLSCKITIGRY